MSSSIEWAESVTAPSCSLSVTAAPGPGVVRCCAVTSAPCWPSTKHGTTSDGPSPAVGDASRVSGPDTATLGRTIRCAQRGAGYLRVS